MTQKPLTLPQAVTVLAELTGWFRSDVERDPTYAAEVAAARCIEARNVVLAARDSKKNGLL